MSVRVKQSDGGLMAVSALASYLCCSGWSSGFISIPVGNGNTGRLNSSSHGEDWAAPQPLSLSQLGRKHHKNSSVISSNQSIIYNHSIQKKNTKFIRALLSSIKVTNHPFIDDYIIFIYNDYMLLFIYYLLLLFTYYHIQFLEMQGSPGVNVWT